MKVAVILLVAVLIILTLQMGTLPTLKKKKPKFASCVECHCVVIPGKYKCPECRYPDPDKAPEPLPEDFE